MKLREKKRIILRIAILQAFRIISFEQINKHNFIQYKDNRKSKELDFNKIKEDFDIPN